jgi:hypothetical protein
MLLSVFLVLGSVTHDSSIGTDRSNKGVVTLGSSKVLEVLLFSSIVGTTIIVVVILILGSPRALYF